MLDERLLPAILFQKADDGGGSADGDGGDDGDGSPDGGQNTGDDLETVEDYKAALADARKDAAKYRTRSKDYAETKDRLEKLEKGLKSIFGEDEDLDPEKLKAKTQSLENELKTERVKRNVTLQAITEGLDPELTIAYLHDKGKLADIDASDSNMISQIVSEAAKNKPALKTGKADKVGAGGGGNDGGEGQKNLNPIDEYRKQVGILNDGGK